MLRRFVLTAVAGLALWSTAALPARAETGSAPTVGRHVDGWRMRISLSLRPSRRERWNVRLTGECPGGRQIVRRLGSDVQPADPLLRLRHGRFELHRAHETRPRYRYTLVGHAVGSDFVGTFRYSETQHVSGRRYACETPLLSWRARRGGGFR